MRWIVRPGWPGNWLALAAGALTTLSLAPFDYWPLALLSVGLFHLGLRSLNPKQAALRGWCYGFGLFGAGTSWVYVSIHEFGAAPMLLAGILTLLFVAAMGLFLVLPAWLWARWLRCSKSPLVDALAFAALWVAQDLFRSWFLTGFPWLYTGYSQLDGPLAGLAPLGGVWLVSFSIALTAALLVNLPGLLIRRKGGLGLLLLLLATPWLSSLLLKDYAWTEPKGNPLRIAAVQGNIQQSLKWDPQQLEMQLRLYQNLTLESKPVELIIWPETALPIVQDRAEGYLGMMGRFASGRNAALLTGLPVRLPNDKGEMRYYNGLTVAGDGQGTYLKQQLVPFGEYVPLQDLLRGLIQFFNLPMSDFARGGDEQPPLEAKGYKIAPYICYEVVYPELAARSAAQSDLLLTISNDAWFGHSIGPLQHLQMAQMRALESGRWMIRVTNNGMTALIDPMGRITQDIPAFQQAVLYGEVLPMQGLTPYLEWRLWPLGLLCSLLLLWALRRHHLERKAGGWSMDEDRFAIGR